MPCIHKIYIVTALVNVQNYWLDKEETNSKGKQIIQVYQNCKEVFDNVILNFSKQLNLLDQNSKIKNCVKVLVSKDAVDIKSSYN